MSDEWEALVADMEHMFWASFYEAQRCQFKELTDQLKEGEFVHYTTSLMAH
jgi:hypothetical protein